MPINSKCTHFFQTRQLKIWSKDHFNFELAWFTQSKEVSMVFFSNSICLPPKKPTISSIVEDHGRPLSLTTQPSSSILSKSAIMISFNYISINSFPWSILFMYWCCIFYWAYTLYVSSAVFTTRDKPEEAGLKKEMSRKNETVITLLETMLSWLRTGIWGYGYLVLINGYLYTWFWNLLRFWQNQLPNYANTHFICSSDTFWIFQHIWFLVYLSIVSSPVFRVRFYSTVNIIW